MALHDPLVVEHEALRKGLAEVQRAAAQNSRRLKKLFPSFRERLSQHIHREDSLYYRSVNEGTPIQDRELLHALRNDHAAAIFTLESLSIRLGKEGLTEEWKKRFNAMARMLQEHFERKEQKLFPAVERLLSPAQKVSLRKALKKAAG